MNRPVLKTLLLSLCCGYISVVAAQTTMHKPSVVGSWHLTHIDSNDAGTGSSVSTQPIAQLIYTNDGHASVQLMYPQTTLSNEFVHDGYEATFGTYEVDEAKHKLTYHIQGSATREKLVGRNEALSYELPDDRHMIIRPVQSDQHWSVTWERN